jgi:hypothetical protein
MLPNPYILLGFGLALLAAAFGGYRHGVSTTTDHYNAVIAEAAVEGERITRLAVENARNRERADRDRLVAEAEAAAGRARADADSARKRMSDLQRRAQEAADADPSVDAWRTTPLPDAIRVLLAPSDNQAG